jgi:hypothetical protein
LEERNKLFEVSCKDYLEKLAQYEAHSMRLEIKHAKAVAIVREEVDGLKR